MPWEASLLNEFVGNNKSLENVRTLNVAINYNTLKRAKIFVIFSCFSIFIRLVMP